MEVKDAVFGNVGSIISFRIGADDAKVMLRYFEPKFTEYDLIHQHTRHFVLTMTIDGEKVPAFSAVTLNLPPLQFSHVDEIVEHSRSLYASSRAYVDKYVSERYLVNQNLPSPQPKPQPKQAPLPAASPEKMPPQPVTRPSSPPAVTQAPEPLPTVIPVGPQAAQTPSSAPTPQPTTQEGKRKRKRNRKRKRPNDAAMPRTPEQSFHAIDDEGTISLH